MKCKTHVWNRVHMLIVLCASRVAIATARCRELWCRFFFQAEDGIRDYKVTGVQTCALPIYGASVAGDLAFGNEQEIHGRCRGNSSMRQHAPAVHGNGARAVGEGDLDAARGRSLLQHRVAAGHLPATPPDRKSTRLNSSHLVISYAVFC